MSKPNSIKIDDVEYVRSDLAPIYDSEIKICVLDRGFVYVGYAKINGDFLEIENAHNIRVWGTTKGLGELVHGATSSTKLDKVGSVKVPLRALISLISVEQSKWKLL